MKSFAVGAELFHAGRQTDRYDESSRISQFLPSRQKHIWGANDTIIQDINSVTIAS